MTSDCSSFSFFSCGAVHDPKRAKAPFGVPDCVVIFERNCPNLLGKPSLHCVFLSLFFFLSSSLSLFPTCLFECILIIHHRLYPDTSQNTINIHFRTPSSLHSQWTGVIRLRIRILLNILKHKLRTIINLYCETTTCILLLPSRIPLTWLNSPLHIHSMRQPHPICTMVGLRDVSHVDTRQVSSLFVPLLRAHSIIHITIIARKVKLHRGHLVLDCPVPTRYLQAVPIKDTKEFTHMRYTAATCDPAEFVSDGYTLRQQLLERHTELFIVLTMYNASISQKEAGEKGRIVYSI